MSRGAVLVMALVAGLPASTLAQGAFKGVELSLGASGPTTFAENPGPLLTAGVQFAAEPHLLVRIVVERVVFGKREIVTFDQTETLVGLPPSADTLPAATAHALLAGARLATSPARTHGFADLGFGVLDFSGGEPAMVATFGFGLATGVTAVSEAFVSFNYAHAFDGDNHLVLRNQRWLTEQRALGYLSIRAGVVIALRRTTRPPVGTRSAEAP